MKRLTLYLNTNYFNSNNLLGLILFTVTAAPQLLFAQNRAIDSLAILLEQSQEDTARVDLMNQLSLEWYAIDLDKGMDYANKALHLSDRLDYRKGRSRAYNLMAIERSIRGNNHLGFELNQKAYTIAKEINDWFLMSNVLNDMAIYYSETGNVPQALENYQKSLKISLKHKDTLGLCTSLLNISGIHYKLGNTKESANYAQQCGSYYAKSKDPKVKIIALTSLGHAFYDQKKYEAAKEKYEAVLELAEAQKDQNFLIETLLAIAHVYAKQEKKEIALNNCLKALEIAQNSNRRVDQVYILDHLSYVYKKQKEFDKSIKCAQQGLEIADQAGLFDIQYNFNEILAELHEKQGHYQLAYQHLNQAKTIEDSLSFAEQERQAMTLEAKYQIEKKEIENRFLREEASKNEVILRKKRWEFYVTILGFIGVSIIAFLLYVAYLEKKKFNEKLQKVVEERTIDLEKSVIQLEKSNAELESFAYIASHDLKEPIRNISSFTKLAIRELESSDKKQIEYYLNFVEDNTIQMKTLVEDVLEFSKIGHSKETARKVDLNAMLKKVEQGLTATINDRKAILKYESLPELYISPTPLFILLKNLIENGLKYNESQTPIIQIKWEKTDEAWQKITVADNGIGIEPEYQSKIFEMFKRLHNRSVYKGSGLGLAICKKIVSNLGGNLSLESYPGEGSRFYIMLPIQKLPDANVVRELTKELI